jgi:glycosyltransferase involved in cell wall biosynthesis
VVAGAPPGCGAVGEILLRDVCAYYPTGHIACAAIPPRGYVEMPDPVLADVPVRKFDRPNEHAVRLLPGRLGSITSVLGFRLGFARRKTALARDIAAFGRAYGANKLCAVLDSPSTISVALEVAARLACPIVSLVWDSPTYLFTPFGLDRLSLSSLTEEFGRLLRHSECAAVVSERMAEEYARKWGVRTVLVRHGLAPAYHRPAGLGPADPGRFVIGFAGSLYARSAWEALLGALDERGWVLGGRSVLIRLVGNDFRLRHRGHAWIEYLGFHTSEDAVAILSRCDANYLPYPFEPHLHELARLSFPSKFAAYAAAGRPVFAHAPEDSSLREYMRSRPVGVVCGSLEPLRITACLERLAAGGEEYQRMALAMAQTARSEFTLEGYLKAWAGVLGVPAARLLEGLDRHGENAPRL